VLASLPPWPPSFAAGAAKASFDVMHTGITKMGARTIMLDRVLAQYGPQAKEVRNVVAGLQC